MGNLNEAYVEMASYLAGLDPKKILDWKPGLDIVQRVEELINKKKESELPPEEQFELDRYLALEHLMALAKIQARIFLKAA